MPPTKKVSRRNKPSAPSKLNCITKKPFKPMTTSASSGSVLPTSVALQLENDVPDFPRGGIASQSHEDKEDIHAGEGTGKRNIQYISKRKDTKKPLRKKSNSAFGGADDLGSLFGAGISGKLPRFANRITLKNVSLGMKLWGVVAEVNEKDLVVSLPGGLKGLVRLIDAFDPVFGDELKGVDALVRIFHIGQLVSCVVSQIDDDSKDNSRRKIWLSLRLSSVHIGVTFDSVQEGMVLCAYVKSIEDHGYILHFGVPSFMGFLNRNTNSGVNNLKVGELVQVLIEKIDSNRKMVYVTFDQDAVSKSVTKDVKGMSIDVLVPGMMVNARVHSVLENGIMLSFHTYFTGTVDVFHLHDPLPKSTWKDGYVKNKKVNARILFIDPSSRAVGLTMNQHLIRNKAPTMGVKIGSIYENSKLVRIDVNIGLLLELPGAIPTPAYVSASEIPEDTAKKIKKSFKEENQLCVRVLGFRNLEGFAIGTLKTSAVEGPLLTHSDLKAGIIVRAKVISVDTFGAIVLFPGGLKALCPLRHMSEFEITKPRKKFKVGAELIFRVLGCKSKRVTVTHKKSMVKSKHPIICSYADATVGLITHGWITKIENHGCFVHFYNGVQGFTPRSELGLEPGTEISSVYHVGQVVKCRVLNCLPASHRISLSFMMKASRSSQEETIKLGSVVAAVVERIGENFLTVYIKSKGYVKGSVNIEHLADHHDQAVLMMSLLKPGYEFDELIVLDMTASSIILSAKKSLIRHANELPADINDVLPQKIYHGYICNVIDNGCFVRFLGRLTGFSPKRMVLDAKRIHLSESFYVGQSVRCYSDEIDVESNRITVSLKPSLCASSDASFITDFFSMEDKIAELQSFDHDGKWYEDFKIGCVVKGKVHELKDVGAVIGFENYTDVFGFIAQCQLNGFSLKSGTTISAAVIDISLRERLVELSLKPEFLENCEPSKVSKKRKKESSTDILPSQKVSAIIEIVKENYIVLSVPQYNNAIGYAPLIDYNIWKVNPKNFTYGQCVTVSAASLPCSSTVERLILSFSSLADEVGVLGLKKAKRSSNYNVGSVVQAEITEIATFDLKVKFGAGCRGRIHITEVNDECSLANPLLKFKVGQTVTSKIVGVMTQGSNVKHQSWELSIKPSILSGSGDDTDESQMNKFTYGKPVVGYVYKMNSDWIWLSISRKINAQLYILDTSCEPSDLCTFQERFCVGQPVNCLVVGINKEKRLLRVIMESKLNGRSSDGESVNDMSGESLHKLISHIHEGDIIGGRVNKILPGIGGLAVQIDPHVHGKVHFTEINESWVPDPLPGYSVGQFVKCKVLDIKRTTNNTVHVDLSLRSSSNASDDSRMTKIEDVRPKSAVQGYVKSISAKGCFICLSRKLDAKVTLSNLSDEFVQHPEIEFPVGKLVVGRVISVEPLSQRIEVSLKDSNSTRSTRSIHDLSSLKVGDIISGTVRRVERYGLFVTIKNTNLVGLCHVSEIPLEDSENIETKYVTGAKVTAKIIKVDEERDRISLGMKNLDDDECSVPTPEEEEESHEITADEDDDLDLMLPSDATSSAIDYEETPILPSNESRASVPPLEIPLDDLLGCPTNEANNVNEDLEPLSSKPRSKKKSKEEKEKEIRAAEERLLENDIPRSAEEFEKVVKASPNSSFLWIKYMAFMLSLADVEKGRNIAERALSTINVREEEEKLNVWVALLNLENEFGNPREEAVKKVFEKALQFCDQKKIYHALLAMYERTNQNQLANELLDRMVKKFKHSCKIWLKKFQNVLKEEEDTQAIVRRALLCLPERKHIKFITRAAILEFKCGVPDRGRSMFETILKEYPKRMDLWSIYLDHEIKCGDVDLIRSLFERAISVSLPPKKIKFVFKRYLEYEKSRGDEDRVEYVKQKAMEYVENTLV